MLLYYILYNNIYIYTYINMYVYIYIYVCMYVCMCVCTYVCMYVCMYVCVRMTPDTSAERASCGSGTSRLTRLTNGWRFTTQGQRGRPATSGGHRATRGRDGTGTGATHHTAADGTTARAGGRRSIRIPPRCTGPVPYQGSSMSIRSYFSGASDADFYR